MPTGRITHGTTIDGRSVNAGDIVTVEPDTFRKLALYGDIEPCEEPKESTPVAPIKSKK